MLHNNSDQIASNNGEFTMCELQQKIKTLTCPAGRFWSFFSTKIYTDHIDILLSKLGYSELVQRLFEKMTFFLMDPLAAGADECNKRALGEHENGTRLSH